MSKGKDEYVMGIDPYGYDDKTYSACVMRKPDGAIVYAKTITDKMQFQKEVEEVARYYSIPPDKILTEKK